MNNVKVAGILPDNYDPLKDEEYMSQYMLRYFKNLLANTLDKILQKEPQISHSIMEESIIRADYLDQGVEEELRHNEFTFLEFENIRRIETEEALDRINHGDYGYCLETGDPIGVKRLIIVPTAKYTLEIQEIKEKSH